VEVFSMSTDVLDRLRAVDPAARMPEPDEDDRERLRRTIVATPLGRPVPWWRRLRGRTLAVLVAGAVLLGGGTVYASGYAADALRPLLAYESDNPSHLDAPGAGSLAETAAVARRYADDLGNGEIPAAGLRAADATFDMDGGLTKGAEDIESNWDEILHAGSPGSEPWRGWSRQYHLLLAPGLAAYESMYTDTLSDYSTPDLVLIAVGDGKITHEEVFLAGNGLMGEQPVTFSDTPPGAWDTAEVASRVGAAVGEAFATRDRAALRALTVPDVLFRETSAGHGLSGRDALLAWFDTIGSSDVVQIKNDPPLAGPGWAVVRWTARRRYDSWIFANGISEPANMATVVEVRDGKVVRIMLYGDSTDGNVLLAPR
jgi:SnoaL-like domain